MGERHMKEATRIEQLIEDDGEVNWQPSYTIWIAAALEAAEKRGEEREREACAVEAEEFGKLYDIGWWLNSTKKEISAQTCLDVAAAIRSREAS